MLDLKTLAATIKPGVKGVSDVCPTLLLLTLWVQKQPRDVIVAFIQIAQEVLMDRALR